MSSGPQSGESAISTLVPPTFIPFMNINRCTFDNIIEDQPYGENIFSVKSIVVRRELQKAGTRRGVPPIGRPVVHRSILAAELNRSASDQVLTDPSFQRTYIAKWRR